MIDLPGRLALLRTLWLLVAAAVCATVLAGWPVLPDLPIIVVVAVALRAGPVVGAVTGLAGGWIVDLMPPGATHPGLTALTYAALGAAAGLLQGTVRVSPAVPALVCAAAEAVLQLSGIGLDLVQRQTPDLLPAGLAVALTAVVGAVLVPPLMQWERRLLHRGLA